MSLSPNAFVPLDALRLTEDIRALEEARKHLDTIEPINVCEDRDTGRTSLRLAQRLLRTLQTYAEKKLRTEFISPKIERPTRKTV